MFTKSVEQISTEMVAHMDKIPKTIVQRLIYSGKVKDAKLWRKMVEAAIRHRVPEEVYEVLVDEYEYHCTRRRWRLAWG